MNDQFRFTEIDRDLIGSQTSRDPLGFQPIWQQRGRDIVRNLTEQTNFAAGFQLLVTVYRLFQSFQHSHPDIRLKLEEFFLLIEQAFAYSTEYIYKDGWVLPGSDKVRIFVRENNCRLSLKSGRGILDNQLSNGTWGLYRGAAYRSKILSESLRSLSSDFLQYMGKDELLERGSRKQLFQYIIQANEAREEGVNFPLYTRRKLVTQLAEIIIKLPQKRILREYLLPRDSIELKLAEKLWEQRKAFDTQDNFRRAFINKSLRIFHGQEILFRQILQCENFISPVERLYEYLFNFPGESVSKVAKKISIDINKFNKAHLEFCKSGQYTLGTAHRFELFCKGIDLTSSESFIRSIIDCHIKVASSRKKEPWLAIENDKIQIITEIEPPPDLDATPGLTWKNDYYLRPLLSIYRGLR